MYLHLGQDKIVAYSEIEGVFDLDETTVSKVTRNFLTRAQKSGEVVSVGSELPKSFVLCADGTVFISPISVQTLVKRSGRKDGKIF